MNNEKERIVPLFFVYVHTPGSHPNSLHLADFCI